MNTTEEQLQAVLESMPSWERNLAMSTAMLSEAMRLFATAVTVNTIVTACQELEEDPEADPKTKTMAFYLQKIFLGGGEIASGDESNANGGEGPRDVADSDDGDQSGGAARDQ